VAFETSNGWRDLDAGATARPEAEKGSKESGPKLYDRELSAVKREQGKKCTAPMTSLAVDREKKKKDGVAVIGEIRSSHDCPEGTGVH